MQGLTLDEIKALHPTIFTATKQETTNTEFRKRTGLFTASELYKLLTGTGKAAASKTVKTYIFEKAYEQLTGETCKNEFSSASTDWGKENESDAIELYEKVKGITVDFKGDNQKFFKVADYQVGATPDGLIGTEGVLECKCPYNGANHLQNLMLKDVESFKSERFEYFVQGQTQLWATGRKWFDFISFDPRVKEESQLFILRVPRDDEFIETLKAVVKQAEKQKAEILESIKSINYL